MAFCEYGLSLMSVPISKTAGKKNVTYSQARSIYGKTLSMFKRWQAGRSRWKKRAHHMPHPCVFPFLQQCLLLFIKDYIPFSARYPRLRKKALDGLMNCLAYWMIYLVFLTKWEVSTDRRWGVGSVFLAKGKLLKCLRALQSTAWRRPHERVFSKTFFMSPLVHWLLIQNVDVMV